MPDKYPYTYAVRKIPVFLQHIRTAGVPQTAVALDYLRKAGFTSSNDRSLLPVFKFLGVLRADGTPSEYYNQVRDELTGRSAMDTLVRRSYGPLFSMHPDAPSKDTTALKAFFKTDAGVADEVARRMTQTFLALCREADFNGVAPKEGNSASAADGDDPASDARGDASGSGLTNSRSPSRVEVCVNVQVVIPDAADATMLDAIFASMAKHLRIG